MIIFPKFNPIEFRYTHFEENYEKDFTNYNTCRDNFIIGENEKISFCLFVKSAIMGEFRVYVLDENGTQIDHTATHLVTAGNFYSAEVPMIYGIGKFWIKILWIDNLEGIVNYYSEKIVCTDNLQYTRLLSWKKTGKWLGYNLDQLYTNNNSFVFSKRLDIATYKNKTFGVNNVIFDNGWGRHEIVDTYPISLKTLNIGYIQGLNEYTQELMSLMRSMDYFALDDEILQITENTEYELVESTEFDDRKGVILSNLSPYKKEYNANLFYQPAIDSLIADGVWILQGGVWNANGVWLSDGVWVA